MMSLPEPARLAVAAAIIAITYAILRGWRGLGDMPPWAQGVRIAVVLLGVSAAVVAAVTLAVALLGGAP